MIKHGTITIIFNDKKIKIYNHSNSHLSYLGAVLIAEITRLLEEMTIDVIIEKFNNIIIYKCGNITKQGTNKKYVEKYCEYIGYYPRSIYGIFNAGYIIEYTQNEEYNYEIDFNKKLFLLDDVCLGNFDELYIINENIESKKYNRL